MKEIITLDYGSGGKKTSDLIEEILLPAFDSEELDKLGDGAILPAAGKLTFSTDSFVVSPWKFPGGNIGKLCVCGTVNDLCMCGGIPEYLSLSFILEEGFLLDDLREIVTSIAQTAKACGVKIVTGDTKVVERGKGDGIYINTAGIGRLVHPDLAPERISEGDAVLVSGYVGDHGTAVMMARDDLMESGAVLSDCMPLTGLSQALFPLGEDLKVLRDPTRGGIATTLNEFTEGRTDVGIELSEEDIPVRGSVRSACELLGLDPLYCANEGKLLAVVAPDRAEEALQALRSTPGGENAAIIGKVTAKAPGRVICRTESGGSRIINKLSGAQLPRIC